MCGKRIKMDYGRKNVAEYLILCINIQKSIEIFNLLCYYYGATQIEYYLLKKCAFYMYKMQALLKYAFSAEQDLCSNKWSYAFWVCSSVWDYALFYFRRFRT